jgi:hypothetical protein
MPEEVKIRVKTFKRTEYIEIGRDTFDKHVGDFITAVGLDNVVNILPLTYEHIDIATQLIVTDYGLIVIYKSKM